jgi:phosphoglycolate phosphatase-like HAD superfamily hydrolase
MKLVIFDIDGTLINSQRICNDCTLSALQEALRVHDVCTDWAAYKSATDLGVLSEICSKELGRDLQTTDMQSYVAAYCKCLRQAKKKHSEEFVEIANTTEMLKTLSKHTEWQPAIATGAYYEIARLKLVLAGVSINGIPMTSSNDSDNRGIITQLAVEKALKFYGIKDFERLVYVGDALWDVKTTRELGMPLLGIGDQHEVLLQEGTSHWLPDYKDLSTFYRYLDEATVPLRR